MRRGKIRPKEADEIKLLVFPTGRQWRAWRNHAIHAIVSAAGRQDDLAQAWIMRVETDEPWQLQDPGEGWISLDRKLVAALTKTAHGEVGREILQVTTTALNNNQVVRGRVLLALVFKYYASGNNGQVIFDLNHLQSIKPINDNLEGFHNTWNMILSELQTVPESSSLQHCYFKQIEHFAPMAQDVNHYKRARQ